MYASIAPRHSTTLQQMSREIADEERGRSDHAKAAFQDACKRHALAVREEPSDDAGVSISWKEVETLFNETLYDARHYDVVVMARDDELSPERIKSVLMRSGRPLLLAPPKPVAAIGRKVAIAWKAGPEAARALTAASSILPRAERVDILCASESAAGDDRVSAEYLAKQLRWHGVQAQVHVDYENSRPSSGRIRQMAYDCDADLLVMGAYGHSRMQEFVFGGCTRDILSDCAVPVLMLH
jgi:nucleotide-binding universal stress UspA family protein